MTTTHPSYKSHRPIYVRAWNALRNFPCGLAQGAKTAPEHNGPAFAALISGGIGSLVMMIFNHFSDTNKEFEAFVWSLGSWMPGSKTGDKTYGEIGSYSGKMTVMLVAWLVSWAVLGYVLRNRSISPRVMFTTLMAVFVAATVMCWYPLFPYLPLMP